MIEMMVFIASQLYLLLFYSLPNHLEHWQCIYIYVADQMFHK